MVRVEFQMCMHIKSLSTHLLKPENIPTETLSAPSQRYLHNLSLMISHGERLRFVGEPAGILIDKKVWSGI